MKKQIKLRNKKVSYLLKRSGRAKCLRLAVYGGGNLVVTAPRGLTLGRLEQYLFQKAGWILEKLQIMKKKKQNGLLFKGSREDYLQHKQEALKLVKEKIKKYNQAYQFFYKKISIRNQKTRWGSCSKAGNLNFNYKIIFLPERSAEYIIAHELCHLKEFNHSMRFWGLVAKTVPDYQKKRSELRGL